MKGPAAWRATNTRNTFGLMEPAVPRLAFMPRLIAPPTSFPPTENDVQMPRNLPSRSGSGYANATEASIAQNRPAEMPHVVAPKSISHLVPYTVLVYRPATYGAYPAAPRNSAQLTPTTFLASVDSEGRCAYKTVEPRNAVPTIRVKVKALAALTRKGVACPPPPMAFIAVHTIVRSGLFRTHIPGHRSCRYR